MLQSGGSCGGQASAAPETQVEPGATAEGVSANADRPAPFTDHPSNSRRASDVHRT